ncbi:MAG TPA: MarR family transcriptional regulator, partial [Iamia sp.]
MGARREINLLGALGMALADGQRDAMRRASGLSDSEVAALNVVGNGRGLSIGQVRAALDLTHPGTVRVVDRLVTAGLVRRGPGQDGRSVSLHLTPDGD